MTVFVHNIDRPRTRALLRISNVLSRVSRFLACAQPQVDFLHSIGVERERAVFVWAHTDTQFFTPGPESAHKSRPSIVSVGLEQRDYRNLAHATHDLDLDVLISGFSRDAQVIARSFPPQLPANMTRRFYSWPDLRQLYRDASVVVVSLFPNRYAAGVQGLMEAMACGRPVVVTSTVGMERYIHPDAALSVPTGDPVALRNAIQHLLAHPERAAAMGRRGRELALERHSIERHVRTLVDDARGEPIRSY
jgi:glycosyltransferase involved in cell wall biosynthesis